MKLKKCYVSSFGKIKDFTYDFNDTLNSIKEENGWGKSTLATFIKAVFYGLNDSKRSVAENERLKFKPWNSTERFGGYIEFEWGGQDFKIERFFGNKESEDTIRLFDLKTGKIHENPKDIGKRIFEIDEDGFLSTTYFSQKDFQIKSNTSLTAKFNSTCDMGDNEAFDKALSRLEEKAKTYKYRGDKGLISDTKRQIFEINDKIEEANKALLTVNTLKVGCNALEKETKDIKSRIDALLEQEKRASKAEADAVRKEQYAKLLNEKNLLQEQKEKSEEVLNGHLASSKEVEAYIACNSEMENISIREKDLSSDINQLENSLSPTKKKSNLPVVFAIIGGLLLVMGTIFSVTLGIFSAPSIALIILSILSFGIALLSLYLGSKNGSKNDERYQEIVQKKKAELNEYGKIKSEYAQKIDAFLSRFNLGEYSDRKTALGTLNSVVLEYTQTVKMIGNVIAKLNEFGSDKSFLNLDEKSDVNLSEIHTARARLQEEYDYKTRELAKKQASIRYYEDVASLIPELEGKKIGLSEKVAQYKEDYDLLTLTQEYLKKADENLKIKYRAPLQDSLNKYLKHIAGDSVSAKIDIDLNVSVEENGADKITDYYSKGYQNLFEICKRFALTDVLFKGEKPFIILDDPFYNLDDNKLSSAIDLIKKLSSEYQIIYFVCHESRDVK